MSEEFGPDFVSVIDEDGNELELEFVDRLEYNGSVYMAFYPAMAADEKDMADYVMSEDYGLIILKVIPGEGDEEELCTLDSEEELDAVYEQFAQRLDEDDEDEE